MEAIILAGGLGTRLRSEVQDIPKPMAPIQSKPFLEHLVDRIVDAGVNRIIFSVGYKSDYIKDHFSSAYKNCEIVYAVEEEQLGTGGAIKNALQFAHSKDVLVLNGDSMFYGDIKALFSFHKKSGADVTFALKPMENIKRYGTVELNSDRKILQFYEKQPKDSGLINVGMYVFNVESFMKCELPNKFSIEHDFFEPKVNELTFMGFPSSGYFLDIGIPEDFKKAQLEIGIFPEIDKNWTLFLDRDGVINKKRENDYVKNLRELEILPGVPAAVANLSSIFGKVVIVTNQQGIGKELMTEQDLHRIHEVILNQIENEGGTVDAVYFAPQLKSENSAMRKPDIGMALKAKKDFPEIDFSKSIIVGDSPTDMEFGRRTNMIPIMVTEEPKNMNEFYTIQGLTHFQEILGSILHP
ncbi:MAG TPA: HAD-IIIA family hydrolase [Gracilimonas sp.]|uniref:HAD-IIIA family hydrolase n=1 Tax=Gracilimonas sp. TaxID=1974203 RepID=UPI002D9C64F0|nr:HAD-IIIA family hydrolase [Gracilimonas sp.]